MLYYYANTGHKLGLERLRRGVALLNSLSNQDVQTQFLVNDFRAGLVAKDLGVKDYVTVEGVQDIDAIAQNGDSIIIDSIEDDHGRLVKYCADFKNVWRFAHDENDKIIHSEILLDLNTVFVDDSYFKESKKEERTLFFLGDADYDKVILGNTDFFKTCDMELLLGNYFFVKYEDDLARLFTLLHEPEEYSELIRTSSIVVTASAQTAFEVKASGGRSIYLNIMPDELYPVSALLEYGIEVIDGFDMEALQKCLATDMVDSGKKLVKVDDKSLLLKL
jgi:hypothetical protein